jgi:hypothetical protein
MEGSCSTGQNPQWAVVPVEEEEEWDIHPILFSSILDMECVFLLQLNQENILNKFCQWSGLII